MTVCGDPAAYLEWRIRLFGSGALLAVMGMYFDVRWMIWIAIAVLMAGFALRFVRRRKDGEEGPPSEEA